MRDARRPVQAKPLIEGESWRITRADLWGFGACLALIFGGLGVWRAFS